MNGVRRWTWSERLSLAAGLALFFFLQRGYLEGPICAAGPQTPFEGQKGFLDAQFWIFTTNHLEHGLGATHGLPVWQVAQPASTGSDAGTAIAVHNSHPPLVALCGAAAGLFLGPTPTAARLPALLFSLCMIGLMYALLRRCFPSLAACLAVIGLAVQPLFFHFATCPEVFLLGHAPLLALLYVALQEAPAASAPVPSPGRRLRPRLILLAILSGLCVAISYATLGVLALWCVGWMAARRCREAYLDAAAAAGGAAVTLGLLLLWLHLGGGSVTHWAERGILRTFSTAGDRPELVGAADAATWSALVEHQWTWLFKGAGWLVWLGLIGCGLCLAEIWRRSRNVEPDPVALPPEQAITAVPELEGSAPALPEVQPEQGSELEPESVQAERQARSQGTLLGALALLFLCEGFLIKQNALTHTYSVAASGFLIAFGLAAVSEQAVLAFRALTLRSAFPARYWIGMILTLASMGAMYRLTDTVDQQQLLTAQTDITPLATAIDKAQREHPGQRVLVYDGWLLPARTVTGLEIPVNQGYIFPWFYRGRAFLCEREWDFHAARPQPLTQPGVWLYPANLGSDPGSGAAESAAVRSAALRNGYEEQIIGGVSIFSRRDHGKPAP